VDQLKQHTYVVITIPGVRMQGNAAECWQFFHQGGRDVLQLVPIQSQRCEVIQSIEEGGRKGGKGIVTQVSEECE